MVVNAPGPPSCCTRTPGANDTTSEIVAASRESASALVDNCDGFRNMFGRLRRAGRRYYNLLMCLRDGERSPVVSTAPAFRSNVFGKKRREARGIRAQHVVALRQTFETVSCPSESLGRGAPAARRYARPTYTPAPATGRPCGSCTDAGKQKRRIALGQGPAKE